MTFNIFAVSAFGNKMVYLLMKFGVPMNFQESSYHFTLPFVRCGKIEWKKPRPWTKLKNMIVSLQY